MFKLTSLAAALWLILLGSVPVQAQSADQAPDIPVAADNAEKYAFDILSEAGYTDQVGREVIILG